MLMKELDKIYCDLLQIEAMLGILSCIEENLEVEYINIIATEYYEKVKKIREQVKNIVDKNTTLADS